MAEPDTFDVAVIGAGIAGLAAAGGLSAAGLSVVVLEGRDRIGGRLLSVVSDGVGLDLGATWFWPGERRVERLIAELGLATHPQHSAGAAVFEAADAVHRLRDNPLDVPSRRLVGGMQALAASLADRLPDGAVRLGRSVTEVTEHQEVLAVAGAGWAVRAAQVILAVPPALAVESMRFDPELPAPLAVLAAATPVWMGAAAKVLVSYDDAFWRADGLAGAAVSHRGPLTEIHDASGPGGHPAALFGFAAATADLRLGRIVDQLCKLFGPRAAHAREVRVQNWADEACTAPSGVELRTDYGLFGHRLFAEPALGGRLRWATTETSPESPGHIEGALAAGDRAVRAVLAGGGGQARYRPRMTASGSTPDAVPGPSHMFTGDVWMEALGVGGRDPHKVHLLKVRFSPGARTAWHSHPVGQILHIADGVGRIQERGGHVHEIRQGDTVVTEPEVWHWHGAGPTTFMTNLAVQQEAHGAAATWGEHVTDEEYAVEPTRD